MYEYDIRVGYHQTDENKILTIPALIDLFQDCSTFQSEDLGIGVDYCRENGFFWVINNWQVEITSLPRLCDRITVFTFPYEFKGFVGKRCFGIKLNGETIVKAASVWSLLSTETYLPVRTNELMHEKYVLEEPLEMGPFKRKIPVPEGGEKMLPITIQNVHLDANHHVNNGKYVAMGASFLPEDVKIKEIRVGYLSQAFLGDVIYPRLVKTEDGYIVSLEDKDGKPYAVMEFK